MIQYSPVLNTFKFNEYTISVLRLDSLHPEISGNKWFKLKHNLIQAKKEQKDTILTVGGAYSNHIAATAVACKQAKINCIGFIRGEETSVMNPTLSLAKENGMLLKFVSREEYKQRYDAIYLNQLQVKYPSCYIVPEGGNNILGEKGCKEILTPELNNYDYIFCAYGTGTTFNGIANSLNENQFLTGVNVLKYEAMLDDMKFKNADTSKISILNNYHFGGYAKHTSELITFKQWFEKEFKIELDYVYTSKLFFAVFDLINKKKLDNKKQILIIHSGGLQGNKGYEERYNLNPKRQVIDPQG